MNVCRLLVIPIAVLALVAAGCGGDSSNESSADATETTVAAETTMTTEETTETSASASASPACGRSPNPAYRRTTGGDPASRVAMFEPARKEAARVRTNTDAGSATFASASR